VTSPAPDSGAFSLLMGGLWQMPFSPRDESFVAQSLSAILGVSAASFQVCPVEDRIYLSQFLARRLVLRFTRSSCLPERSLSCLSTFSMILVYLLPGLALVIPRCFLGWRLERNPPMLMPSRRIMFFFRS
jgi:hypothetical protein